MKKLLLLSAIVTCSYTLFAQNPDLRRKIEVTGNAEQEITPDILNVSVSLQEYMNGKTKITIEQLENQLENAVKAAGIPKEDFTINNVSDYNDTWQKKKAPDFLAGKQYSIRVSDLNKYNFIISQVDAKGIQSTNIDSYDYSKMAELKRSLKIKALLDARDKATYLLASIGDKVGDAIQITDSDNSSYPGPRPMFKTMSMAAVAAAPADSDIGFKKIKLSFQVNAVFEIVK